MKTCESKTNLELWPFANLGIFEQILKHCHLDIVNII